MGGLIGFVKLGKGVKGDRGGDDDQLYVPVLAKCRDAVKIPECLFLDPAFIPGNIVKGSLVFALHPVAVDESPSSVMAGRDIQYGGIVASVGGT